MARHTAKDATEDIEAVLGRFQAWNESRSESRLDSKGAAKSGPKGGAKSDTGIATGREAKPAKDGVREISYEEALAASRSRWKGRDGGVSPTAAASAAGDEHGGTRQNGSVSVEKAVRAASVIPPFVPLAAAVPEAKTSLAVRSEAAPLPASRKAASSSGAGAGRGEVHRTSLRQEFRAVLTQSVTTTAAPRAAASRARKEDAERQVSMSLRVAASEQAMIRRRAAEAGVSASAYLRQCALDVEILRAQVQGYMAAAEAARDRMTEYAEAPRAMVAMAAEGWLSRLQRKLWGARATQLSLKA